MADSSLAFPEARPKIPPEPFVVMDLVNEAVEEANKRIAACEMGIARQLLSLVSQKVPGRDASVGARLENLLELKAATVSYRDTLVELSNGDQQGMPAR
jgi:hypothetical protein